MTQPFIEAIHPSIHPSIHSPDSFISSHRHLVVAPRKVGDAVSPGAGDVTTWLSIEEPRFKIWQPFSTASSTFLSNQGTTVSPPGTKHDAVNGLTSIPTSTLDLSLADSHFFNPEAGLASTLTRRG
jgi:hypothetical protein